ncbi:MAG: hypothetical protein LBG66_01840 [Gallionellaceae bacterium]|jgi:hypothetical protein|nr:hypothetical protein [Gallionellaceae bacterium]
MFSHYLIRPIFVCAAIASVLLTGCASSGKQSAQDMPRRPDVVTWYMIWGEGKKPARTLYFAQEGLNGMVPVSSPKSPTGMDVIEDPVRHINLMIVHESAKESDSVYKKLLVDCRSKQYAEQMSFAVYRDDRTSQAVQSGSHAMTAPWQAQLARFACGTTADLTTANGFLSVGAIADNKLVDLAWAVPWKDGTRPPYTTTKTKEQVLAEGQKVLAQSKKQLEQAKQMVGDVYLQGAATPQERLQKDLAKTEEDYLAARRRGNTINPMLETWVGATGTQLLQGWGNPNHMENDSNGDQLLTYVYDSSGVLVNGYGAVVGGETHVCYITWRIRSGIALTYGWQGEGSDGARECASWNLKVYPGPYPEKQY